MMIDKIAIVRRGDAASRTAATPENNRYHQIFSELLALGQAADLEAGKLCINVHTQAYPGGEIRGQVTK